MSAITKLISILLLFALLNGCKTFEVRIGVGLKDGHYDGWAVGIGNQSHRK